MWFVYTLFLAKCVANTLRERWILQCGFCVACLSTALLLNGYNLYLSIVNLTVSYPFFALGYILRSKWKEQIVAFPAIVTAHKILFLCIVVICALICYIVGNVNGMVEMYNAGYGGNVFLFVIGAFTGTTMIAILSVFCNSYSGKGLIQLYSKGTMLMLAWQIIFLFLIDLMFSKFLAQIAHNDFVTFILAALIFVAFVPIIRRINKYCPILIGYRT